MLRFRSFFIAMVAAALLAGCAKPPSSTATLTTQSVPDEQVAAMAEQAMPAALIDKSIVTGAIKPHKLAGRTLYVDSIADFAKLKPGEVILTFDDGPHPSITPKILATLDDYGVKATFFMVGRMAKAHPETAQLVASAGHSVGSHTHGHENLSSIGYDAAIQSVATSDGEIADALKPAGKQLAPFFRFPYLVETRALRSDLTEAGIVIFGVDIDSWDYLNQSPEQVLKRTLKRLDAKGSGIVLFHDIHARTAELLPLFLDALEERGYTVVRAIPKKKTLFDMLKVAALH